jgi:hypothetical protein
MKLSSMYAPTTKKRHQGSTNIWQFTKTPKGRKQWYHNFAAANNPDERLLGNWRGKGF